jgi:hypothetical protein
MIRSPSEPDYKIKAMTYQYPEAPEGVPKGWIAYRHPEGGLYYVHTDSKTFTEVNILCDEIHEDIEYSRTFLFSALETEIKKRDLSELKVDEVQLVLEPMLDERGVMVCYYFVNPRTRSLFWLDDWEGREIFKDCRGVLSYPHKGLAIQAHYWRHWDLYPNFCEVTQELKDEVMDTILHATCDHLTSNTSSFPLKHDSLTKYLHVLERIDPTRVGNRKHTAIILGRIMNIFYYNYFMNFHGEECARLNFDQTVYGWRYHPSPLMSILAPLLFLAPVDNVRLLHRIYVDHIMSKEKWDMFVTKLNSQLQETSVLATVLLNANVGFLPKELGTGTAAQQCVTCMSFAASIASIILGLAFMGHIRLEARNDPRKAAEFLNGLWHEKHGLEKLAIIYSLPHAFLIWGMGLFFVAFVLQWFDGGYSGSWILQVIEGALLLPLMLLVAWSIWAIRDCSAPWWFQSDPSQPQRQEDEGDRKDRIDAKSLQEPESCHTDVTAADQAKPLGQTLTRPSEAGFSV